MQYFSHIWYFSQCWWFGITYMLQNIDVSHWIQWPATKWLASLQWRHNERHGVSNHQRLDCLLKCLFRPRSKNISKLRVTGLCEGNSPVTGEFPAPMASNAENVPIWWRHHDIAKRLTRPLAEMMWFPWIHQQVRIKLSCLTLLDDDIGGYCNLFLLIECVMSGAFHLLYELKCN